VAKAAYKYSGAQDVVSCVTNPHLSSCIKAAVTVALVVATAGEGEVEAAAMEAAEEAGAGVAERVGAKAAESCGLSFTPGTKVLLASGKAVPISSLKPGEKVVSTSTKTGKTQAGTIAAVLVHHDTNRYDLTVRARSRTAVIRTTSNHPFWDATTRRWVKAGALRYGTRLRTPSGGTATVLGGHAPRNRSGWMWDLTIPGNHDFYIATAAADILVHNINQFCDIATLKGYAKQIREAGLDWQSVNRRTFAVGQDEEGNLVAGSSNRFDAGQIEMARSLGIRRVPSIYDQHAEENLISDYQGSFTQLKRVGTDVRAPCGVEEHNCAGQLDRLGIEHE
jgi:hypothetical protein